MDSNEQNSEVHLKRKYTLKRDKYHPSDKICKLTLSSDVLPPKFDLRDNLMNVLDQGELGSCTANAFAGSISFLEKKQFNVDFSPSRLFIYYNERDIEGTITEDSGASLRDGVTALMKYGVCTETKWPYVISKFTNKPTSDCYDEGIKYKLDSALKIYQSLKQLKLSLTSGFPFVFGLMIYESFESDEVSKTGKVPMPQANEEVLGGHALLCVGYDDSINSFIIRNSWGSGWGDKGFCYIPYSYMTNPSLAYDFWKLYKMHTSPNPKPIFKEEHIEKSENDTKLEAQKKKKL